MVELRKRPAPKETATPAPAAKRSASKPRAQATKTKPAKPTEPKVETKPTTNKSDKDKGVKSDNFPLSNSSPGSVVPLSGLKTEIKLNTDKSTSLDKLLASSEKGIVIFSYPKASTPGCTTQACLFRDSYEPLTQAGLSVFGLSADSPKSNTTFITKQKLPFELLCDVDGVVSGPLGLKKPNPAKGTVRGVVLLTKVEGNDDQAKVEVYFLGGPQKTLDVVLEWVEKGKAKL